MAHRTHIGHGAAGRLAGGRLATSDDELTFQDRERRCVMTNLERAARDVIASRQPATVSGWALVSQEKLDALESALKELEAPAVPTEVDLTLARPGDVCRYRDGGLGLITLRIEHKEKWLWHSSRDAWHQRNGCSDGRCPSADMIAVFDQRDGRLICGVDITSTGDSK